jgi:hypothetical protein
MSGESPDDPILRRIRTSLRMIYGDRIERLVLFGVAMHTRIPTTTSQCFSRT